MPRFEDRLGAVLAVLVAACTKTAAPGPAIVVEVAAASASPTVATEDAAADSSPTPSATPTIAAALPVTGTCTARAELTLPDGKKVSCYPYRCRDGACLHGCNDSEDCAGSRGPAELATEGWPLQCLGKTGCVPLHPSAVHGRKP
jgi:hypothetical protein